MSEPKRMPKARMYARDRATKEMVVDEDGRWLEYATVWPGKFESHDDVVLNLDHPAVTEPCDATGKPKYYISISPVKAKPKGGAGGRRAPAREDDDELF